MSGTTTNPALDALGDHLERAASTAIASGGMRPSGRHWGKVALVPALALFVVAGMLIALLVPNGSSDSAEASVISAARETTHRVMGRFELTVGATGFTGLAGGEDGVELKTTGSYDADQGLFSAALDTSSVLTSLTGDELFADVGPTIDAVIDHNDVYLDVSPVASIIGAEWLQVTLPDVVATESGGLPSLMDPASLLDALEGVGADMKSVGQEDVRGVATTHYSGTLNLEEAYNSLSPEDRAALEGTLGSLLDTVDLPDLPVDVWVDEAGLVRRVSLRADASVLGIPGLGEGGGVGVTVEFFDIGEDVDIEVPEADQVTTIDEIGDRLTSGIDGLLQDLDDLDLGDLEGLLDDLPDDLFDDEGIPNSPAPGTDPSQPTTPTTV